MDGHKDRRDTEWFHPRYASSASAANPLVLPSKNEGDVYHEIQQQCSGTRGPRGSGQVQDGGCGRPWCSDLILKNNIYLQIRPIKLNYHDIYSIYFFQNPYLADKWIVRQNDETFFVINPFCIQFRVSSFILQEFIHLTWYIAPVLHGSTPAGQALFLFTGGDIRLRRTKQPQKLDRR